MPDGNWFNWLLFNSLSKISKCGVNCVVFDNKVQGMSMLERNVFFFSCPIQEPKIYKLSN